MEIRFYSLNRHYAYYKNRVDKELPNWYVKIDGELRDSINISNPEIVIDISSTANIDAVAPAEENKKELIQQFIENPFNSVDYVYIPYLKRYYFVTKINLLRKNILSYSLHVDVLMFGYFIRQQQAFVTRNQKRYNRLLPDERRIVTNKKEQTIFKPVRSANDKVNVTFNPNLGAGAKNVIVNATRDFMLREFESLITNYTRQSSLTNIPDVKKTFTFDATVWSLITTPAGLTDVVHACFLDDNIRSYFSGVYVYPFEINVGEFKGQSLQKIVYGAYEYNQGQTIEKFIHKASTDPLIIEPTEAWVTEDISSLSKELILEDFTITDDWFTDFNDLEPYSQYEIYIPYYGWKTLSISALRGHRLLVYYTINYSTNNATVYLYDYTDSHIIWSSNCVIGVEVGLSSSNIREKRDRETANGTNLAIGLVGSMLSLGGGIATGKVSAVTGGASGIMKSIGQYELNELTNYERGQIQFSGNTTALLSPQEVYIRKIKSLIHYQLTNDFLEQQGGVLNELVYLQNIHGYTEIGEIPNIFYGSAVHPVPTDDEINEIMTLLKNGVIFR